MRLVAVKLLRLLSSQLLSMPHVKQQDRRLATSTLRIRLHSAFYYYYWPSSLIKALCIK